MAVNDGDDKDEDKKKKIKFFKYIVTKILQYHVLPADHSAVDLAKNSTVATILQAKDGTYGDLHRRIKVEKKLLPPTLELNFYAKVVAADKEASNGVIHVIDHPLIPPPSLFDVTFNLPDFYSTFTSATQKVGGTKYIDFQYELNITHPKDYKTHGTPLVSIFAPTNAAFGLLPPRLKFFLFSPFGTKALQKVLRYHAVPKTLLLSEFVVKHKHGKQEIEPFAENDDGLFHREFDIPSALPNATLHIVADKSKVLPVEGKSLLFWCRDLVCSIQVLSRPRSRLMTRLRSRSTVRP